MRASFVGAAVALVCAILIPPSLAADSGGKVFRIGTLPWIGYGQWEVAQQRGLFGKNGLRQVEFVTFSEDKDLHAALASGKVDAANLSTQGAMALVSEGVPIKVVMLEDFSLTADAILADASIGSIKDLKGKRVAFEQGSTSDILLNFALQSQALKVSDIQSVPMPAADAGAALIAGRVPVAVTYEPYISAAREKDHHLKVLYTAGTDPGIVSDVLAVRNEVIRSRGADVQRLVRSWDDALQYYNTHLAEARQMIAKSVGSSSNDLQSAFDGVRFYSLAENRGQLGGSFSQKTYTEVESAAVRAGVLTNPVPAAQVIDTQFVTVK